MVRRRALPVLSAALGLLAAGPVAAQSPAQNDSAAAAARRSDGLPLITTRTLPFTTDQGTWISLDVHPDGSTIVFELLGCSSPRFLVHLV